MSFKRPIGTLRAVALGFGGWMPSIYHFYDVRLGRSIEATDQPLNLRQNRT